MDAKRIYRPFEGTFIDKEIMALQFQREALLHRQDAYSSLGNQIIFDLIQDLQGRIEGVPILPLDADVSDIAHFQVKSEKYNPNITILVALSRSINYDSFKINRKYFVDFIDVRKEYYTDLMDLNRDVYVLCQGSGRKETVTKVFQGSIIKMHTTSGNKYYSIKLCDGHVVNKQVKTLGKSIFFNYQQLIAQMYSLNIQKFCLYKSKDSGYEIVNVEEQFNLL